jgi:type IV secretion system protein VirB3
MNITPDPLFVAATRPAMKWGVTMDAIVVGGAVTAIVFIGTGSIFSLFLYVPIHATMYLLCLKDPSIIRLLKLWGNTKAKSIGWRFWGAATASPTLSTRKKKGIPEC